jgi:hypothetical protein
VARQAHPEGASRALIAGVGGLADALAAAPLTRSPDAPLLLTRRAELPEATDRAGLPLEFFGWGLLSWRRE